MYKYLINKLTAGLVFADGKHANGDARTKKHSVTESVHSKRSRYSDVDEKGRSVFHLAKSDVPEKTNRKLQVVVVRVLREVP